VQDPTTRQIGDSGRWLPPTAEVTAEVSPARSYPELFRVTGPLLSFVFRTEDVCQRCNQFIETAGLSIRVSPSHPYNAGRAGPRDSDPTMTL